MIVFDNLTLIFGGTPRRARALGAHYLPDQSQLAKCLRRNYPHVELVIRDGALVDVQPLPAEEENESAAPVTDAAQQEGSEL